MLLCTMLCMIQGGKCSRTNTLISRYISCNFNESDTTVATTAESAQNLIFDMDSNGHWPLVNTSSVLLSENGCQLWLVHQKWKGESSKRAKKNQTAMIKRELMWKFEIYSFLTRFSCSTMALISERLMSLTFRDNDCSQLQFVSIFFFVYFGWEGWPWRINTKNEAKWN